MKVLIVTHSQDNDSVNLVTESLSDQGVDVLRLDSDFYPNQIRITGSYGPEGQSMEIASAEQSIPLEQIDAVWYRRFNAGGRLEPEQLGDSLNACLQETRMTLWGHIRGLECFQLDPLTCIRRADYKEVQLREAIKLGILCPRTIITNNPDAVREFVNSADSPVITKMQSQFAIYRDDVENVMFTNLVTPESLEQLDVCV